LHQKRDNPKSWSFYNHFWPFFCQLHEYLSQNWGSEEHFEVPNLPKSQLAQKLQHKTQFYSFPGVFNFERKKFEK
jgi:hypothetical protein